MLSEFLGSCVILGKKVDFSTKSVDILNIVCSIYHHSLVPEHHSACKLGLLARPDVKFVLHGLLLHYGV